MPDVSALSAIRYLPIDAGGQRFGILLDDIRAVFRVENTVDSPYTDHDTQLSSERELQIIDLAYLLKGVEHSGRRQHTILVNGDAGDVLLLVDAVHPIRNADSDLQRTLPLTIGTAQVIFHTAIIESKSLVLILDVHRLVSHIGQLLVGEANHVSY